MAKKEKIISVSLVLSIVLLIISCIFTLYQNKPDGYSFNVERVVKKIIL